MNDTYVNWKKNKCAKDQKRKRLCCCIFFNHTLYMKDTCLAQKMTIFNFSKHPLIVPAPQLLFYQTISNPPVYSHPPVSRVLYTRLLGWSKVPCLTNIAQSHSLLTTESCMGPWPLAFLHNVFNLQEYFCENFFIFPLDPEAFNHPPPMSVLVFLKTSLPYQLFYITLCIPKLHILYFPL